MLVQWDDVSEVYKKITMPACIIINVEESLKTLASPTDHFKVGDWSHLNPITRNTGS